MATSSTFTTLKKILHAGSGPLPEFKTDTKTIIHYEILMPPAEVDIVAFPKNNDEYKNIDSTKKCWPDGYGKPLELIIGKKFQLPVLENCIKTMLVNEISCFDIAKSELYSYPITSKRLRDISHAEIDKKYIDTHSHHCAASGPIKTGYEILDDLIENPRSLRFIIHLLQVLQPEQYNVDTWQLNAEQKLDCLERYRQDGNALFSEKKYDEASTYYKKALGIIENLLLLEKPGDPEWTELDKKNIPFYLNLTQCFLNKSMYYEAVQTATEVLKRDEFNEKALFRRAKAKIGCWDLELAEQDFKILAEHYPKSVGIIQEQLAIIAKKRMEKHVSEKNSYKAMMKGLCSGD